MDRFSFIEGVGDEVVLILVGMAVVALVTAIMCYNLGLSSLLPRKSTPLPPLRPHAGPHSETCPICLDTLSYPVETNCGHTFCGSCLLSMREHSEWLLSPLPCAMCRQTVTLIFLNFNEDEVEGVGRDHPELLDKIGMYNRRFSGAPRPFLDYIYDIPTLARQMISDRGIDIFMRFRIYFYFAIGLIYVVTPMDIFPESVFGIAGILDDIFVVLIIAVHITSIYRNYVAFRGSDNGNTNGNSYPTVN